MDYINININSNNKNKHMSLEKNFETLKALHKKYKA